MSGYGLTCRLSMCYPNFTASKFVAMSIFMKFLFHFAPSLKIVSLCKKNNFLLVLLLQTRCKLSYFIGYRCLQPSHQKRFDYHNPTLEFIEQLWVVNLESDHVLP